MLVLGLETSCDECAAAVVRDGREILSQTVATQIDFHRPYLGVVPELAGRLHTEAVVPVVRETLAKAALSPQDLSGLAVTYKPGLMGSLLVGLTFVKALAFSLGRPFVGVDHIRAHLYAAHLEQDIPYPYLGLLVSGGHTLICRVENWDAVTALGSSLDDACGEAFDKVAKHYRMGYPGGPAVERLAAGGDPGAFHFPDPSLHKENHPYDVSYSGLKTAVINQLEQFRVSGKPASLENIAASFQKTAVDILLKRLDRAAEDTGLKRIVAGGGVAANSYLRRQLKSRENYQVFFPSLGLCTDNGAMVAGLGFHYLSRGEVSGFDLCAGSRPVRGAGPLL
jgi:N6-L-threonylcarbamoyladenine synthase